MANVSIVFVGASDQDNKPDGPFYLTNGPGWTAVCAWASGDTADEYPHLRELARRGRVEGTDQLGIDLAGACVTAPENVRGVLEELAERVGVGDPKEILVIMGDEGDLP